MSDKDKDEIVNIIDEALEGTGMQIARNSKGEILDGNEILSMLSDASMVERMESSKFAYEFRRSGQTKRSAMVIEALVNIITSLHTPLPADKQAELQEIMDLQKEADTKWKNSHTYSYTIKELELSGWCDKDAFYGDMISVCILDMMRQFYEEGHSGMSASVVSTIFGKLSDFQPLTPLTGQDDEWNEIGNDEFQNKRRSSVFKRDGVAYDMNGKVFRNKGGSCYTSSGSRVNIEFPYTPTIE